MIDQELYVGRIVAAGMTPGGKLAAMYRVSSRSFPNRQAAINGATVSIVPKPGHETDIQKNPYIAYNCARVYQQTAVVSNGSHTDPIVEKLAAGMRPRDAFLYALAALDYEKDDYNTPRIAAAVRKGTTCGWLGSIRHDGLDVRKFELTPGTCFYAATYEEQIPNGHYVMDFAAETAADCCAYMLGKASDGGATPMARFTKPVSAVCYLETDEGFDVAAADAEA